MRRILINLWRRLVSGSPRIDRIVWFESHADLPEHLAPRVLAVIGGSPDSPKWAAFECPCATGHRIAVPLRRARGATWTLTVSSSEAPSLYPSVDESTDQRCHFWLREGRVSWAPDRRGGRRAAQRLSRDI